MKAFYCMQKIDKWQGYHKSKEHTTHSFTTLVDHVFKLLPVTYDNATYKFCTTREKKNSNAPEILNVKNQHSENNTAARDYNRSAPTCKIINTLR